MQPDAMQLLIEEIASSDAPVDLLLLADPSEQKVLSYLPSSKCFVASSRGVVVGACAVRPLEVGAHEIMSISIRPEYQRLGIGTKLLKWIIDFYEKAGVSRLEVGTGTFGYQLAFYQRLGFRVTGIERDFFLNNYDEPIFEDGIQLMDMLRLTMKYEQPYSPDAARDT